MCVYSLFPNKRFFGACQCVVGEYYLLLPYHTEHFIHKTRVYVHKNRGFPGGVELLSEAKRWWNQERNKATGMSVAVKPNNSRNVSSESEGNDELRMNIFRSLDLARDQPGVLLEEDKIVLPCEAGKRVKDWINGKNKLSLILVGKLGAGKSTLVNSLLRNKGAEVGSKLSPVTMKVCQHESGLRNIWLPQLNLRIHDIDVSVWDTPGLGDPNQARGAACLGEIRRTWDSNEISLLIYCVDMTCTRSDVGDLNAIKSITSELGVDVWSHSFFALTRANQVRIPRSAEPNTSLKGYFQSRVQQWEWFLKEEYLVKEGVPRNIVDEIPLIPCGYEDEPLSFLKEPNWPSTFWETCLVRMLFESIPAFLTVSNMSTDGSLSQETSRVICHRMKDPTKADEAFISTLLNNSSPDEVVHYLSDAMIARVSRRKLKTATCVFVGASVAAILAGFASSLM